MLPPETERELWPLEQRYHFTINTWESSPDKKDEITLYALDIPDERLIEELLEKQAGNYTVQIIRDPEFETTRSEVIDYL
jgi:hypothetical protein